MTLKTMIKNIPENIAYLILLYMHGELTNEQHDELDRWVEESDDNQELFAAATDEKHIKNTINKIIYGPYYPY